MPGTAITRPWIPSKSMRTGRPAGAAGIAVVSAWRGAGRGALSLRAGIGDGGVSRGSRGAAPARAASSSLSGSSGLGSALLSTVRYSDLVSGLSYADMSSSDVLRPTLVLAKNHRYLPL